MNAYRHHALASSLAVLLVVGLGHESAAQVVYNNRAAFLAEIAGFQQQTLDFEAQAAGTELPDPSTLSGITFSGFGTPNLFIDDTYAAASGNNYLGVNNPGTFNQFSYADTVAMTFEPVNAIGLSVITAEVPDLTLFAGDIRIEVPGIGSVSIDPGSPDRVTPGGDAIYFIGIIDRSNAFDTAALTGSGALGFYNVDDITLAVVPEPAVTWAMVVLAPALAAACWRRRISSRGGSV